MGGWLVSNFAVLAAAMRRGEGSFPREDDELESSDSRASNERESWPNSYDLFLSIQSHRKKS